MLRLADFEGDWQLSRVIGNGLGPDAMMRGRARFTAVPGGLELYEEGEMQLEGQGTFRAERRYLWRDEGARIAVLFDDGRAFHDFDPALAHPEAEHPCAPDHYRVAYDFGAWPDWHVTWRVAGPRKSYVMRSRYSR